MLLIYIKRLVQTKHSYYDIINILNGENNNNFIPL